MSSAASAGRKHAETAHPYRTAFQRDRDRIVHSAAYRRLSAKTQVFTGEMGDYHRSRLTHTHEVASVARTLGRALGLNEDLIEALALLHDLGHPPYGHAGEDVLAECLRDHGGFSHNGQALRVVELLEVRYPNFSGLNLSVEVLQGQQHRIAKHAPPGQSPLLEVQCVDAADSIAYNTHDADDAMELGLLKLDELLETSLWAEAHRRVSRRWTNLGENDLRRALLHELIDWQVSTLIADTRQRLDEQHIESVADVRAAGILVTPTSELSAQQAQLAKLLFSRVYRHPQVLAHRQPAQASLHEMFTALVADPGKLPATFQQRIAAAGLHRTVADYLAGMTDRFARREYERICGKIVVGMVPMP